MREDDLIEIDIPGRRLELLVPADKIARRLAARAVRPPALTRGFLGLYSRLVQGADRAAVLNFNDPPAGRAPHGHPR